MTETFYEVLGVSEDATQEEITGAYRQKVKEYHPDVSEREDADEVFKRVVRAEEVLSDEEKRARYDRLGHESYVRRVEDASAAGGNGSPWTAEDGSDRNHDVGFGGMNVDEAAASAAGSASGGAAATSRTSRAGTTTAGGAGDADANVGFGRAASRQSSAGWSEDTDAYSRWSDDAYSRGGIGEEDSTYAVHDWDDEDAGPSTVTVEFTQQFAIYALALFALYPMIAYMTLSSAYPLVVNLIGAIFAFVVVGYSLTVPKLSLVTFGAWSVLAPILAFTVVEWSLWLELFGVLACWIPFGYAVVVAYFTRPS